MNKVTIHVYFDDPFWIGVVERITDDRLSAARIIFGQEPRDYEVRSLNQTAE